MPVAELDIRNAIVSLIAGVSGAGPVYNRLKLAAFLSDFNIQNVDDANKINVVFVRWVGFSEQVTSFDDPISQIENYEIWFYRGRLDAPDGADSESELVLFIQNVRAALRDSANRHLVLTTPGNIVSQGGLSTGSPLIDTNELGDFVCHRFIGRMSVSVEEC
jgi:hypothetical protein